MNILNKLGCDGIQGYYFSKPLPKEEIEGWLEKGKCSVDKKS